MYFWYQQGNKTLPGLYFQWGCWDTNQSDLVQALKHSVQVRKKLKCTILLHSCKMFRRLVEGIRCWRWTETAATKVVVNSPIFVDWNRKWTAVETQLPIGRTNVGIVHFVQITGYHSVFLQLSFTKGWKHPQVSSKWSAVWLDLQLATLFVITGITAAFSVTLFIIWLSILVGKWCLAVSCFMERSLCWDIFLTTCWYLLGMERIKEETSELYFCSRLFSFFLLFFEIQSRTNSTASLNNTEYILCSSSLLQYNLNVHLLDTHYSPTWSNGYESIGLTKKDSQSLKSRRWSSSEVWKPAIESETRRERRHISDPTAERQTRWHAVRRWYDLTSGRPADDKQRRS